MDFAFANFVNQSQLLFPQLFLNASPFAQQNSALLNQLVLNQLPINVYVQLLQRQNQSQAANLQNQINRLNLPQPANDIMVKKVEPLNRQKKINEKPVSQQINTKQQQSQKCYNKFCNYKGEKFQQVPSQNRTDVSLTFCDNCQKLYKKNSYCEHCDQVYTNRKNQQDDQVWIQCDECSRWNHVSCGNTQETSKIQCQREYYCLKCRQKCKTNKIKDSYQNEFSGGLSNNNNSPNSDAYELKPLKPKIKQITKADELYEPVERKPPNEARKEKHLILAVTKDNKQQLSYRINLLEEEIRKDLEQLREVNGCLANDQMPAQKKIKQNQPFQSPSQHILSPSPERASVMKEDIESQIKGKSNITDIKSNKISKNNSNEPLTRPRRGTKINYRSMVGEL